jgi:hypothetical protein
MSVYGYTTHLSFKLLDFASQTWHTDEYDNWRKLDALINDLQLTTPYAVATGAVNTFVVDYTPDKTLAVGLTLAFAPNHTNTGPATLAVDGQAAKTIHLDGAALVGSEFPIGSYVKVIYDGTYFNVIEPRNVVPTIADGTISHAKLTTGAPDWDNSGNETVTGSATIGNNAIITGDVKSSTNQIFFRQASTSFTSGTITFSASDPSGGNNGDLWFKYT